MKFICGLALITFVGCAPSAEYQAHYRAAKDQVLAMKAQCNEGNQGACIDYQERINSCRHVQANNAVAGDNLDILNIADVTLPCAGLENVAF